MPEKNGRFKLAGKELINIYPGTPEEMDLL